MCDNCKQGVCGCDPAVSQASRSAMLSVQEKLAKAEELIASLRKDSTGWDEKSVAEGKRGDNLAATVCELERVLEATRAQRRQAELEFAQSQEENEHLKTLWKATVDEANIVNKKLAQSQHELTAAFNHAEALRADRNKFQDLWRRLPASYSKSGLCYRLLARICTLVGLVVLAYYSFWASFNFVTWLLR